MQISAAACGALKVLLPFLEIDDVRFPCCLLRRCPVAGCRRTGFCAAEHRLFRAPSQRGRNSAVTGAHAAAIPSSQSGMMMLNCHEMMGRMAGMMGQGMMGHGQGMMGMRGSMMGQQG